MSNEKNSAAAAATPSSTLSSNFLRAIVESDLASGAHAREGMPSVITRFPPEPNGYLHVGHAKSICVNFGLARDYNGRCHLRFDDTNPEKEDQEYVDTIMDSVKWLGFSWEQGGQEFLHYASDYFDKLYEMAEYLIKTGKAYVDSQSAEDMAKNRGNFGTVGTNSPFRNRPAEESLQIFRDMKAGKYKDGEHILRAKMSEDAMSSPNMTNRDPALYRIRHAHHHRTGDDWCIYPMYDYTHAGIPGSPPLLRLAGRHPRGRRLLPAPGAAPV
jgi:glutaminyl-tRNA synthetase